MVKCIFDKVKQYVLVLLITLTITIIYFGIQGKSDNQLIALEESKSIDNFIEVVIQQEELDGMISYSLCEYNIQNAIIVFFYKVTNNIFKAVNFYYFLSFSFISLSAFWYLKKLRISFGVATYIAVLLAYIPFHVDRGEGQIITSTFFLVPIFMGICNDLIYEESEETINIKYLMIMGIVPFVDIRLAIMMIILSSVLLIHRRKSNVTKRVLLHLCPLIILTLVVNYLLSPLSKGTIEQNIKLAREEGLRILDMVMPIRYHFVDRLWDFRCEYDVSFSAHGEAGLNSMGTLLATFFAFSMVTLFFRLQIDKRISWMAWINIIVILISNMGGFCVLFEYFGIYVGYWNRMAIFIIINTAATMGILVDKYSSYMKQRVNTKFVNLIMTMLGIIAFLEIFLRQNML